jgi:hypothetical protein
MAKPKYYIERNIKGGLTRSLRKIDVGAITEDMHEPIKAALKEAAVQGAAAERQRTLDLIRNRPEATGAVLREAIVYLGIYEVLGYE